MPNPLSGYITAWRNDYIIIANNLWSMGSMLQRAGDALQLEDFANAGANLINAKSNAWGAAMAFQTGANNLYDDMYTAMHWIDNNWPEGGEAYELTIDKMLEAIWDGDLLRWFHFVTYIDSMRAGIWNLEIYDTHLADLYRHFSV